MNELLVILLVIPILTGLGIALIKKRTAGLVINILGSIGLAGVGLALAWQVLSVPGAVLAYGGLLRLDSLGGLLLGIVCLVGAPASLLAIPYIDHEVCEGRIASSRWRGYFLLQYIFIFTMMVIVMVDSLGLMWVALEATTIVSALLVGYTREKAALEAAWKYIIIGTVGLGLAMLGTIFFYAAGIQVTGGSLNWSTLMQHAQALDPALLKLGFILALVGFGTKAGLAPMHTWLPDAHSQAPAPVSALLSGVLLNCAVYVLLRYHMIIQAGPLAGFSSGLLVIFGLISMSLVLPFILIQSDFKRLLAYSSIEHIGIIAVGLGFGGKLAVYGAVLHLVTHALTKSTLFLLAGYISQRFHSRKLARIKGVIQVMPITGALLLACGLAITGSPPFGIFVSEFAVLAGGVSQGQTAAVVVFVIAITVVFAGFAFYLGKMVFGCQPDRIIKSDGPAWSLALLAAPVVLVLVLGVYMHPALREAINIVVDLVRGV